MIGNSNFTDSILTSVMRRSRAGILSQKTDICNIPSNAQEAQRRGWEGGVRAGRGIQYVMMASRGDMYSRNHSSYGYLRSAQGWTQSLSWVKEEDRRGAGDDDQTIVCTLTEKS